ncbi:glycoside hydrolase family 5 protein [Sphingomonas sp. IC-11]|uniref:cellulase family glycosylhydrolase n=1 Tax=Sphingomonas sp. IC-11 TaxID=2898528 RepID=UPI001E4211C4|nr:cellulase family glycosylhydrolase [Sphingomonas sp. IC-11]MCD2317334.1 glycoside hydrolase family 5 protein [Sphingomonas sp. IC-11]
MRALAVTALLLLATPAIAGPVKSTASKNINLSSSPLMGVNLSGCEFVDNGALCPTPSAINTYIDKGFNAFRIPFRGAQASNPVVIAKIKAAADAAAARGAYVILDRHDYGNTFDAAGAAWWAALMKNFPDDRHVLVDTMNEPKKGRSYEKDASGKSYATDVNEGIAAFRKAGFKHVLLIEWRNWAGMQNFNKNETADKPCSSPACSFDRAGGLKDPLGRTMISGHRYPDSDGSGTSATCVSNTTASKLVGNTTAAAQARTMKVWIGEFAFGNALGVNATCKAIGADLVRYMRSLPKTYVGVSWWGGGAGWKEDYHYKVEPKKGTFASAPDSEYLKILVGK